MFSKERERYQQMKEKLNTIRSFECSPFYFVKWKKTGCGMIMVFIRNRDDHPEMKWNSQAMASAVLL